MNNFYIVFFDILRNIYCEEKIVQNVIEKLSTYYYRNCSIKISKNVILIYIPQNEINRYPSLNVVVEEAMQEEYDTIQLENTNYINQFVLPIQLKDLESYLTINKSII